MAHIRVISSCNWITITILSKKCPTLKPIMEVETLQRLEDGSESRPFDECLQRDGERERERKREQVLVFLLT